MINTQETIDEVPEVELSKEERIELLSNWIAKNTTLVAKAQALSKEVIDRNLVDLNRSLVFEFTPFYDEYLVGVHIDHAIFGHFWINILDDDKIQFLPWVNYWYDEKIVKTHEEAVQFLDDLDGKSEFSLCKDEPSKREIEKVEEFIDLVTTKPNIKKANIIVFNFFNNYRSVVDSEIKNIKAFLSAQQGVVLLNPETETRTPIEKIKGDYDHLLLHDPVLFVAENNEELQSEISERLAAFRSLECRRSAILYAIQKISCLNEYECVVNCNTALSGKPGKIVKIDKEGVVHIHNIFKAKSIEVHSPLELPSQSKNALINKYGI